MENLSAITLLAVTLAIACTNSANEKPVAPTPAKNDLGGYQLVGDSVVIPSFEIEVEVSSKAAEKLKKDKETIIVNAMFSGIPTDKKLIDANEGQLPMLAESKKELSLAGKVKFENIKFSKKMYDGLEDKDIELLINVYSGRRSSENNLLDCGIVSEKMSVVAGKNHPITCKLIYGED